MHLERFKGKCCWKSSIVFLTALLASWFILGLITGDYGFKNLLYLVLAYLGVQLAIKQRKK